MEVKVVYHNGDDLCEGTFQLNRIMLSNLEVTTNPTKTSYSPGEAIDYGGMVVTATYQDGTTKDVTKQCSITPVSGTIFEADINAKIVFVEGFDDIMCYLSLYKASDESDIPVDSDLEITVLPKTCYSEGEAITYDGMVVSELHFDDGTRLNVTDFCEVTPAAGTLFTSSQDTVSVKCPPVLEAYYYDYHGRGYTKNGRWLVNASDYYTDIYEVQSSHTYRIGLGATSTYMFNALFITTNVTTASVNQSGTLIANISSPEAYYYIDYTAPSNGYIVITKGQSIPNIKTYVRDFSAAKTKYTQFSLSAKTLVSIEITAYPSKIEYSLNETIDYTGLQIVAHYDDGSSVDVTASCTFNPIEGSAFEGAATVTVTYSNESCTFELMQTAKVPVSLTVTRKPNKMSYRYTDDAFNYSGIVVTASYNDGTTADVTNLCTYSSSLTSKLQSDITYTENDVTVSTSLRFTRIKPVLGGVTLISPPTKTAYKVEEHFDFTGLKVRVKYEDGSTITLTESNISYEYWPDVGIALYTRIDRIEEDTTYVPIGFEKIGVSYWEDGEEWVDDGALSYSVSFELSTIEMQYIYVSAQPTKNTYTEGELIDYSGMVITAHYTDGSTTQISPKRVKNTKSLLPSYTIKNIGYDITPKDGKDFNSITDKIVSISYIDEFGTERTCATTLNEAVSQSMKLKVTKLPDQITYSTGELLNYDGVTVVAHFSDGTNTDIDLTAIDAATNDPKFLEYSPASGSDLPSSNPITVSVKSVPFVSTTVYNDETGYVSAGTWTRSGTNYRTDVYKVKAGAYVVSLGAVVGTKFAAMFTTTDYTTVSQASFSGTSIVDKTNPDAYDYVRFTAPSDGYILITKDNASTDGLRTYVFKMDVTKSESTTFEVGQVGLVSPSMTIKVTDGPETTLFREGGTLAYIGLKVTGYMHDGTGTELVLSDITGDSKLLEFDPAEGETAEPGMDEVTVKSVIPQTPHAFDLVTGEVDNGTWKCKISSTHYSDVYVVKSGHKYYLFTGKYVGNVFKVMFTTADVTQATADITGTSIYSYRTLKINSSMIDLFEAPSDGYIVVTKSIANGSTAAKPKIPTYLFDISDTKTATTAFSIDIEEVEKINAAECEYYLELKSIPLKMYYIEEKILKETGEILADNSWVEVGWLLQQITACVTYTDILTGNSRTIRHSVSVPSSPPGYSSYDYIEENYSWRERMHNAAFGIPWAWQFFNLSSSYIYNFEFIGSLLCARYENGDEWSCSYNSSDLYVNTDKNWDGTPREYKTVLVPVCKLRRNLELKIETLPDKTSYRAGETIDYTGLKVVMDYNDVAGKKIDVTSAALSHTYPSAGSAMPNKDTRVRVRYFWNEGHLKRFDYQGGYVDGDKWIRSANESHYSDIHAVDAKQEYEIALGENTGNCLSVLFTTVDVTKADSDVSGVGIANVINPAANSNVTFTPPASGYIVITKDTSGKSGIDTYVIAHDVYDYDMAVYFDLKIDNT